MRFNVNSKVDVKFLAKTFKSWSKNNLFLDLMPLILYVLWPRMKQIWNINIVYIFIETWSEDGDADWTRPRLNGGQQPVDPVYRRLGGQANLLILLKLFQLFKLHPPHFNIIHKLFYNRFANTIVKFYNKTFLSSSDFEFCSMQQI